MKAFAKGKSVWKGNGRLLEAFWKLFPHNIIVPCDKRTCHQKLTCIKHGHLHCNRYNSILIFIWSSVDLIWQIEMGEIASAVHLL